VASEGYADVQHWAYSTRHARHDAMGMAPTQEMLLSAEGLEGVLDSLADCFVLLPGAATQAERSNDLAVAVEWVSGLCQPDATVVVHSDWSALERILIGLRAK